ncbi:MAG: transketolase C-terminal domain-containing protein [Fibrobacterota bacterium]
MTQKHTLRPRGVSARPVLSGTHFLNGNEAAAEGALAAGCLFAAGYPITPSTEMAGRFAERLPALGGVYIQMEDEIAAAMAVLGASWAGKKALTFTSGPGFSLMMESLGYAAATETPSVFVDVQRGGPSTGLPTLPAQGDFMQARWGSHGDYEVIALAPASPQECFDLMVRAFALTEKYRVPVCFMMDECVAHMTERVRIPAAARISRALRRFAYAGQGGRIHVTGLTHGRDGFPDISVAAQEKLVRRLTGKIRNAAVVLTDINEFGVRGADVVVLACGVSARVAHAAMLQARAQGIRVGLLQLRTVWPFPEQRIAELSARVKALVMVELNLGQLYFEMERCAKGRCNTLLCGNAGGAPHTPEEILKIIRRAL